MSEKEIEKMAENLEDDQMLELFQTLEEELSEVTVSEELIQRTLAAAESGAVSEKKAPVMPRAKKRRKQRAWIYTMAAAAAVILIYVGSGVGRKAVETEIMSEGNGNTASSTEASVMQDGEPLEEWNSGEGDGMMDSSSTAFESVRDESCEASAEPPADAKDEADKQIEDTIEVAEAERELQEALQLCGYEMEVLYAQYEKATDMADSTVWRVSGELADGSVAEIWLYNEKWVELQLTKADGTKQVYSLDSQTAKEVWECLME